MYLRDIQIEADEHSENELGFPFSWSAHHVKESLLHFLPKKFTLDGSSKVTLRCGPREFSEDPLRSSVLGTTLFVAEDFDFASYKQADAEQRQEHMLDFLVKSLTNLVPANSNDLRYIFDAADAVRAAHFAVDIPTRMSHLSPDRRRKFVIFRSIGLEVGESWSLQLSSRDGSKVERFWITCRPDYLDRRDMFNSAVWEGDGVEIRSRRGKIEVVVNFSTGTVELWGKSIDQTKIGCRYDRQSIDIVQRVERAVARAGHALSCGEYAEVIRLLEPYRAHLSTAQLKRLTQAHSQLP